MTTLSPQRTPHAPVAGEPVAHEPDGRTVVRAGRVLAALTLALVVASAAVGLALDGLYREADATVAMFRGYDLVTLLVAAPLLALTLRPSLRNAPRVQLVQAGLLAYVAHDYAYYVFGMAFNDVFLLHIATFSVSAFGLGFVLASLDVPALAGLLPARSAMRITGVVLALLAAVLGVMWVVGSLRFAVGGYTPGDGNLLITPVELVHLGYVLDLSVLVPTYLLAATLLWRCHSWGLVVGMVVAVSGLVTQLTYMAALAAQALADVPGASAFDPFEPVIVALYLTATALLVGVVGQPRSLPGR